MQIYIAIFKGSLWYSFVFFAFTHSSNRLETISFPSLLLFPFSLSFFLYFLLSPMFSREMVMNGVRFKNIKMDENKMLQTFKNFQSSFAYSLLGLRGHSKPIVAVCLITSENLEGHRPTVFVFRRVSRA